ncbi:MAG: hypothetical protein DRI61_05085 [Chloroflexi bacterium]|nr:MAG: hypothetical protein DRI61_05085 [Chloroflexota bacterium]
MSEKDGKKLDVAKILEALGMGGKEEAIAKAIGQLTSTDKIEFITYLYPFEDDKIALMRSIAKRYGYKWLEDWINEKLKLRTSVLGWRANQLTGIASERRREQSRFSFLSRLFKRERKEKGLGEVESFE